MSDTIKQIVFGAYVLFSFISFIFFGLFLFNVFMIGVFGGEFMPIFSVDGQFNVLSMLVVLHGFLVVSYSAGKGVTNGS